MEVTIIGKDPLKLKESAKRKEHGNASFLAYLGNGLAQKEELENFKEIVKEVEKRIDCRECANCCINMCARITLGDVKRIAKKLEIPKSAFVKKYLVRDARGRFSMKQMPCPFLDLKNKLCVIYETRPESCRSFPHLKEDLKKASEMILMNSKFCPIVYNVLENAKSAEI